MSDETRLQSADMTDESEIEGNGMTEEEYGISYDVKYSLWIGFAELGRQRERSGVHI